LFFLSAWAASLSVNPAGMPGEPQIVTGEGLPPGVYALEVELPGGEERVFTVEAPDGSFRFPFVPEKPGIYFFRLALDGRKLEALLEVPLPKPHLTESGLWVNYAHTVPLPEPDRWLGPVVWGRKAYVARALLVLEVDRITGAVVRHYPPHRVRALETGEKGVWVELEDGRRLTLDAFKTLPFEAPWTDLKELAALETALGPYAGERPYWSYLAQKSQDPKALSAMGPDLLRRGHRVELAWGRDHPFGYLIEAARFGREEGLEAALLRTRFLFDYVPLFPGSEAFFREAADWLSAQGEANEAARLELGIGHLRHYRRLHLNVGLFALMLFFAAAYLALLLKALAAGGRPLGAGLRFSERFLLLALLLLLLGSGVLYGLARQADARLTEGFSRASLATLKARETLRTLPDPGLRQALLEGGSAEAPSAALRFRAGRPLAAVAWDRDFGPVVEGLGLGGDPWTAVYREAGMVREAVPSDRELEFLFFAAELKGLAARPVETLRRLAENPLILSLLAFLSALLFLLHTLALVRGAPRKPNLVVRTLELLLPGLAGFHLGVGFFLFALALWGAYGLYLGEAYGAVLLALAYALNLALVFSLWKEARA